MNFISNITNIGVPIYLLPITGTEFIASGVLINVGSRDEKWPEEAGLVHAFEHLFFGGTNKFPSRKALAEYIEEVGGSMNAFTSREFTFFYNKVPFSNFERSIDILSEQFQYSLLSSEIISSEIQVIIQELKKAQDNPGGFLQDLTYKAIFKSHPISHSTLGLEESLMKFKRENLVSFRDRFYHPANYIFLVAGKIDPAEAVKMFDRYFVTKIEKPANIRTPQNLLEKPDPKVVARKKISQVYINLAAPIMLATNEEKLSLYLFSWMIGAGSSSPLFEEIRNKRGLCYAVSSGYYPGIDAGLFRVYMATDIKNYKEAIKISLSIIMDYKNNKERFEKIKKMRLETLPAKYENPLSVIVDAAYENVFFGKPQGYQDIIESIKSVTIQDIESVVNKYLKPEQFTTALLIPEDENKGIENSSKRKTEE